MSRDWTPKETYLIEQHDLKTNTGIGSIWDFMENAAWVIDGKEIPLNSAEEIALRKQFPVIGKFLEPFEDLYHKLSQFDGGVEFLHQKDAELAAYIETGKGDPASYLVKWFEGELDEGFYYRERNDKLLVETICQEAVEKGLNNWVLTDPDCLQVRRLVAFDEQNIFQLMQVDSYGEERLGDPTIYQLAWAEIDIADYSKKEIRSTLERYGYESFKDLKSAAGSRNEAYGQLAEMFFETEVADCYVQQFTSWNEALEEVEKRTRLDLRAQREIDDKHLVSLIRSANKNTVVPSSGENERCEKGEER